MLAAGRLDQRVTIQEPGIERNEIGEGVVSWNDIGTVWACVEPLNGREFWAQQQVQAEITTRISIRYRNDVTAAMRILHNGMIYNIKSVINPETRRENLVLMCSEGVNDG